MHLILLEYLLNNIFFLVSASFKILHIKVMLKKTNFIKTIDKIYTTATVTLRIL